MMSNFQTERILLRKFTEDDWEDLLELAIKFENSDLANYDYPWPTTKEEIKKITNDLSKLEDYLGVELTETGKLIGFIAFREVKHKEGNPINPQNRTHNFGYNFNFDYHGKGYATEACKIILDYMFQELHVDLIQTGASNKNLRSIKLLEKLGFIKTGTITESFRKDENGNPIEFTGVHFEFTKESYFAK